MIDIGIRLIGLAALIAACTPSPRQPAGPVEIVISRHGDDCTAEIEGQSYSVFSEAGAVEAHLARLMTQGRTAKLPDEIADTPWRCIGAIVLAGQRVGLSIGFTAEPPPNPVRNEY